MKHVIFFVLTAITITTNAQTFFINDSRKVSTKDTSKKQLVITIAPAFKNKKIEIYNSTGKILLALKDVILEKDISKDLNSNYCLTITEDHKVKKYPGSYNLQDTFQLKLDGQLIGPFYQRPIVKIKPLKISDTTSAKDYHPGYVLYDAIYINEKLEQKKDYETVRLILQYYGITDANKANNRYLYPFLKHVNMAQGGGNGLT